MSTLANWLFESGLDMSEQIVGFTHFLNYEWETVYRDDGSERAYERLKVNVFLWKSDIIHIPNVKSIVTSAAHVLFRRPDMQTQSARLFKRSKIGFVQEENHFQHIEFSLDTR